MSIEPKEKVQKKYMFYVSKTNSQQKQSNNIVLSNPKLSSSSSVSASTRKTTPATVEKCKSEIVKDAVAEWQQ